MSDSGYNQPITMNWPIINPPTPLNNAPVVTLSPSLANVSVHVGATINVAPGHYTNTPTLTYQWQTSIDGNTWINIPTLGTATSFIVTVLQVALNVAVVETATTVDGSVSIRSNMIAALL